VPNGVISFRRYQLPESCVPKWTESKEPLCKIHITKNKTIEDINGFLQVDFANKYIVSSTSEINIISKIDVIGRWCDE
jgi:hypothetical protein